MPFDFFPHNWTDLVKIDSVWLTDITQAFSSLAEERRGLRDRPFRKITIKNTGVKQSETARILLAMMRTAHDTSRIPLYPDMSITTATSSGTTINCDTTLRRFGLTCPIVIYQLDGDGRPTNIQFNFLTGITSSTLTLETSLTGSYPAGSRVIPCIQCYQELDQSTQLLTEYFSTATRTFQEASGGTAIGVPAAAAPNAVTAYNSQTSGAATESGTLQILDVDLLKHDWTDGLPARVLRAGESRAQGRGTLVALQGSRPQLEYVLQLKFFKRTNWFEFLKFWDSRCGRLIPFWMVSPNTLWKTVGISTTYIDIATPTGAFIQDLLDFCPYVGVVKTDGTIYIAKVSTIADNGTSWRINFAAAIPSVSLGNVKRTSRASIVRFTEDTMTEEWTTDSAVQIKVGMRDILLEKNLSWTDFVTPCGDGDHGIA